MERIKTMKSENQDDGCIVYSIWSEVRNCSLVSVVPSLQHEYCSKLCSAAELPEHEMGGGVTL